MQDFDINTKNPDEENAKGKFLTFIIGKELYGIDISYVTEIVGIQTITVMPNMPAYIKGIINLRGIIVPLMDIRLRFSLEPKEYDDRTCIVVVDFAGTSIGLIVDSISEVIDLRAESIVELPHGNLGLANRYIKNIGKINNSVILLLDCEKLLTAEEFIAVSEVI